MNVKTISVSLRIVAGLMLIIATQDLPYSYYQLLRLVVFTSSIFLVWYFIKSKVLILGWLFVIPALIFNPITPLYLEKSLWVSIDIIIAGLFFASLMAAKYENKIDSY